MARPRMTDAEREAKRKARNAFIFSDAAYKHYNPQQDGFGSFEEWVRKAEALFGSDQAETVKPQFRTKSDQFSQDLAFLFLTDFPETQAKLKSAYRNSLFVHHPDHGGSNEACIEALKAFERLSKRFH